MNVRFIRAAIAAGVSAAIISLVFVVVASSGLLKDMSLGPQQYVIAIAAVGFIFCLVYLFFGPETASSAPIYATPHLPLTLVIDSLNESKPNFHIEA